MPVAHWLHLRTSNLIESPFAAVRLRQRVRKGAGSRTKGLLMAGSPTSVLHEGVRLVPCPCRCRWQRSGGRERDGSRP